MKRRTRAELVDHPRLEGVSVLRISYRPPVWPVELGRERDRELSMMCARGYSVARMAEERGVAHQTMTNELSALYRKLGAVDRNDFLARLYRVDMANEGVS